MNKQLLPKSTKDTALAVVCFLFRIPITRRRIYTEEFLQTQGITATEAHKRKVLGQIEYSIHTADHPLGTKVAAAFEDEKARIESGETDSVLEIDPEIAARFAARVLFARKNFMTDLFKLIPFLRMKHAGSPQKSKIAADGSYTVKVPGHVDIRLDASEETKKHLNLK